MKRFFSLWVVLMVSIYTMAQTLNVVAPNTVMVGTSFEVEFVVEGRASDFQGPSFEGFTVLSGPNNMFSNSVTYIEGKMTEKCSTRYKYVVQAIQEGSFAIEPASCVVNDKQIQSRGVTVKVTQAPSRWQKQSKPERKTKKNDRKQKNSKVDGRVD